MFSAGFGFETEPIPTNPITGMSKSMVAKST